ncbi:MAG: hypothetical protein RQ826_05895 [Xanthomonadales bacterium]|nr:hypothetical protein [Xanthomonadales bacterium]
MAIALGWLMLALAAPVAAQVDGRCEVLMPDTDITRSTVSPTSVGCDLRCFFERANEFCIEDSETGELVCTPGDPTEVWQSFPVDDCEAEPIIRRLGGVPRDSLDADLKAALDNLEAQTVADTIAFHELPATDIGRVKRLADNGRGELTADLYARVFEIAFLDPAVRTAEEQLIAEAFADEWHTRHIDSLTRAKAEFDAWAANPCAYVPPEGFDYNPDPNGTLCTGDFTLAQLFTTVIPPSLAEFVAYGQVLAGLTLPDPESAIAAADAARAMQMEAAGAVAAGTTAAIVSALVFTANLILPWASVGVVMAKTVGITLGATLSSLGVGFFFGPILIVFVGVLIAVLQGINIFTAADIGPSLEEALAAPRPTLLQVLATPQLNQEFFTAYLMTTLPGVDTSGRPVPDSTDDWFLVTDKDDGNPVELETLPYIGWEQDPFGWAARLGNGWFIVEKDLSSIPEAGVDQVAGQTLAIEYLGWTENPLAVREMFAWRIGNQFFILPKGGDLQTDGHFSDELLFLDPAACDPECDPATNDPRRIATILSDDTPPSIQGEVAPPPNAAGWHNIASVDVNFNCADFAPSGQDGTATGGGCGPNATVTDESASPAGTDVTGTATDRAGNTATATVTVKLDRTPPTINGSRAPEANGFGWNNENVTVSFECTDALSGVFLCANNLVINTEGAGQSLPGDAQDFAGNQNSTTVDDINIDFTPPSIVGSASPAPNAAGWNNTDVTVHFDCSDALSGIDSCTADVVLGEGANQSQGGAATDRAGNGKATEVTGINVDKTPPVVIVSTPPESVPEYLLHQLVSAEWSASDALSGLAGAPTASAADGAPIDTASAGEKTFEVQADDIAGNQTTVQHSYIVLSPEEAIGQLEEGVQSLQEEGVLKQNQAKGLLSPLANAVRSIKRDKTDAACSQLADFIAEVSAKTPSPIDPDTASALITAAEDIAATSLRCP